MAKKRIEVEETIEETTASYVVIAPFKDSKKYGDKYYAVGEDVSYFDSERLEKAIERKLVEHK